MKDTTKIYVDIESLFDLRQAALFDLYESKEKLGDYLNSESYNFRDCDVFEGVDMDKYKEVYGAKAVGMIPRSVVTYILMTLRSKLANIEKRNTFHNESKVPEILLNVYPFELSESHKEQMQNMLFVKLESETIISVVSMSPKELSPYFMKTSGLTACFIYDFAGWMNAHSGSLEGCKIPEVLLYFPSLYVVKPSEAEVSQITKLGFKDVFSYTEYLMSSVANFNFLPVVFYTNIVTANCYLTKFDDVLKETPLSDEKDDEKYKDFAEQVQQAQS